MCGVCVSVCACVCCVLCYGTAQMQRRTRSRSPIASAQIIADQRGVALVLVAPTRNGSNTCEQGRCHAPQSAIIQALAIDSRVSARRCI